MSDLASIIFASQLACTGRPDTSKMPTPEEIQIAANFVGLKRLPDRIGVSELGCIDRSGNTVGLYYIGYRLVLILDAFREDEGGLTVLVHELRHQYQDDNGIPLTECDAADYSAQWAYLYEQTVWAGNALYSLRNCVGGQNYDRIDDYVLFYALQGLSVTWPELVDPVTEPDYDPTWDNIRGEGLHDVDGD